MTRLAIIGVGSPSGDDQAGWWVAQALERGGLSARLSCQTRIVALDRPGATLVRHLCDADAAVLIDAVHSGQAPGVIHRVDDPASIEKDTRVSSHGFGVASALALASAIGALPATLVLYGIEIGAASADAAPSAAVSTAVAALAARIEAEAVARWPREASSSVILSGRITPA
ncbi:MAG: hydrogenase maturation protease [Rhodanobacter sp.]|nr:hydrogenase maturation protease [Rhodanobacter sp.]